MTTVTSHYIEVTDEHGVPTGEQVTLDEANNRGLWHQTAHVVVYTTNGKVLIQKRSAIIVRDPGLLDISVGAAIRVGETPQQALVRKVYEEVGLTIDPTLLKSVSTTKYNHKLPRYNKHVRVILHNYILEIESPNVPLRYLRSEVSWAGFISLAQAHQLVTTGKLPSIGTLMPRYHYYRSLLAQVDLARTKT